jgi:hypothetical protein
MLETSFVNSCSCTIHRHASSQGRAPPARGPRGCAPTLITEVWVRGHPLWRCVVTAKLLSWECQRARWQLPSISTPEVNE